MEPRTGKMTTSTTILEHIEGQRKARRLTKKESRTRKHQNEKFKRGTTTTTKIQTKHSQSKATGGSHRFSFLSDEGGKYQKLMNLACTLNNTITVSARLRAEQGFKIV